MLLHGTIINGAIVLDEKESIPEGTRVEVELKAPKPEIDKTPEMERKAASPLGEGLMKLAGTAVGLPEDMAAQHDYYLHGTPKR